MTLPNAFTSGWSVGMSAAQKLTLHARESESLTDSDGTKDGEDICPNLSRKITYGLVSMGQNEIHSCDKNGEATKQPRRATVSRR